MEHIFTNTVRSTEVDTIGHVNNAKYLEYMEWARFEWLKELGLTMEAMRERGILPVVVNININYRKEVLMDETLKIVTKPLTVGNKSSVIGQEIYNEAGDLVADAKITSVMIDAKARRAVEAPAELQKFFEHVPKI
ncbi:acyl-CoA thioesterase [Brevibacillus dissolubilis]|uniref:acyl-CoA thioesterase n=1 Tax=Brevibacillus dissolubilis TaxID=1844116 RepID=UPI001116BD19|nr:thioesterase family protein [Brevibacillus dissolubilis]